MNDDPEMDRELDAIAQRYARRGRGGLAAPYSALEPANYMLLQERERRLIGWLEGSGLGDPDAIRLLEVGCGSGANLLQFLRLGFSPENLVGNELLPDRVAEARRRLPAGVRLLAGNAAELDLAPGSFDVVFQSTVFTSVLDHGLHTRLARRMWDLVRPGGGVLWYDFVYDNPRNPDVRGIPVDKVRRLFPGSSPTTWRLTLAPPIARRVTRISPALYTCFNSIPWLRTHVLCWFPKAGESPLCDSSGRSSNP